MPGSIHLELQILANAVFLFALTTKWRGWRTLHQAFCRLAAQRGWSVVAVGTLAVAVNVGLGLFVYQPVPGVQDEFAYLLTADTFAHGRLSNPTHPLWQHFESPHIFHRPTYQAKYPPGQGMVLAVGQIFFGRAIVGVWLTYAAACAAVCWMLQEWVPPRWAVVGALLCLFNSRMTLGWVQGYLYPAGPHSTGWGQTYWGGAVAMLGGAILFGALPRIIRRQRMRDGLLMGAGLAILSVSRPYEGLIASLSAAVVLAIWVSRQILGGQHRSAMRISIPILVVVLATFGWLMSYNAAVTGRPFKMPYQVWKEKYSNPSMWTTFLSPEDGPHKQVGPKLLRQWEFFIRILLIAPLAAGLWVAFRRPWIGLAVLVCHLTLMAVLVQNTRGHPHYLAPVVAPLAAVLAAGFRQLSAWRWRGQRFGRVVASALVATYVASFGITVWTNGIVRPIPDNWQWTRIREELQNQLVADGKRHLILVRYGANHNWHFQWVYNGADIDGAPVVWAHDLGAEKNRRLLEYFSDREIWTLEADAVPPKLLPGSSVESEQG